MTHARRRRARASTPRRSWSATATAPRGSPGSWAAQVSEVSESTTRVLLEVATWNGVNILRTSRKLGLRSEASNRFEKQLHPELAMRAQRIASRLLVELCGARLVPGTIDVAAEMPRAAPARAARRRASTRCSGCGSSRELCADYLERLGFEVERRRRRPRRRGPGPPPLRRHPRGRPDRGGRAHPRLRRAPARDAARDGRRRAARLTREQALRRRAEDVMRDLGFDEVVTLEPHRPRTMPTRLRLAADDPRGAPIAVSNPLSRGALGAADDAARLAARRRPLQPRPRRRARGAVRVRAAPTCREGRARGGRARRRVRRASARRRRTSRTGIGCARRRARCAAPSWRGGRATRPTSSRSRACSRRSARQLGAELEVEAGERAVPAPGPRRPGRWSAASAAGWIGELHPLVCRAVGPRRGGRLRGRPGAAASPPRRSASERYEDVTTYPGRPPGPRGRRRRERRGRAGPRGGARAAAASCCARPRSSTSTAASRSARAARASRCGSSSAPPTAPSPTRRSPSVRERDQGRARRRSEGRSRELTATRRPGAGRRRLRLRRRARRASSSGATRGSSWPRPPSRSDAGTRLDRLYPRYRVPLELDRARPRRGRGRRRGDRRLPARRRGAGRRRAARARACRSSTSRPTSGSATCRPTSAGTARTATPELLDERRLRATELHRERDPRAPSWSPTRAATRPRRCWRWRRWPRPGLIDDVVSTPSPGSRAPGAAAGSELALRRPWTENSSPYGVEGHRHAPEIEQELRRARSPSAGDLRPAPAAARPGRAGELLRRPDRERRRRTSCATLYARALRGRAVRRGRRRRRRACATCATPTSAGSTRALDASGRVLVFAAIDNLWKGAAGQAIQNLNLMLGPRRDGGAAVSDRRLLPLALGRRRRPASRSSTRPSWRPGSAPRASPAGSRAAAGPTSALLVCDAEQVASALLLTRNAAAAAPVRVCRERVRRAARSGPRSSTPATPTPPPASGATATRCAMRDAAAAALGARAARRSRSPRPG